MLRKVLLSVAVLVTLACAGASIAEAHGPHHCRGGYGYGGPRYGGYGYYPAYRSPYGYGGPGYYGGSGFSYYRGYGGYGRSYSGVGISIGF